MPGPDRIIADAPHWRWTQIESALLSVPDDMLTLARRAGASDDDGCKLARAKIADHVRRQLLGNPE